MMRERAKRIFKRDLIGIAIGGAYLLWVLATDIGIPCPFYTVTGLQCPGCGISRMLMALLRLDFRAAFHYNPFLLVTSPLLLVILIESDLRYVQNRSGKRLWIQILILGELIGLLTFGILRNIL